MIRYHGYQPTEHGGPSRHSLGSKANTPAQLNNLPQGYLDGSFATTADLVSVSREKDARKCVPKGLDKRNDTYKENTPIGVGTYTDVQGRVM